MSQTRVEVVVTDDPDAMHFYVRGSSQNIEVLRQVTSQVSDALKAENTVERMGWRVNSEKVWGSDVQHHQSFARFSNPKRETVK